MTAEGLGKPSSVTSQRSTNGFIAGVCQLIRRPMFIALILSCLSTAIKTAAWYGQTIIPDDSLLPNEWETLSPSYKEVVITTLKTLLSWSIALLEYVPLTLANSVADQAHINLTNLRGAIEAMDLTWFLLFLHFAKHATLNWHQYAGLALAGLGCAIVNKPDWLFPELDRRIAKIQQKLGEQIAQFFNRICSCFKSKQEPTVYQGSLSDRNLVDPDNIVIPTVVKPDGKRLSICVIDGKLKIEEQEPNNERSVDVPKGFALRKKSTKSVASTIKIEPSMLNDEKELMKSTSDAVNLQINQHSADIEPVSVCSNDDETKNSPTCSIRTRIFFGGWLLGQAAFYVLAVFMFLEHRRLIAVLALSAAATGVKTIAWYMHTVLGDHQLLPPSLTPRSPKTRQFAFAAVKVVMSWFIALGEYVPLTLANRTADNHGISLAKVRGAIEAMDLLWLVAFMLMVKGERLQWQHLLGLAVATIGVGVANTDVDAEI